MNKEEEEIRGGGEAEETAEGKSDGERGGG